MWTKRRSATHCLEGTPWHLGTSRVNTLTNQIGVRFRWSGKKRRRVLEEKHSDTWKQADKSKSKFRVHRGSPFTIVTSFSLALVNLRENMINKRKQTIILNISQTKRKERPQNTNISRKQVSYQQATWYLISCSTEWVSSTSPMTYCSNALSGALPWRYALRKVLFSRRKRRKHDVMRDDGRVSTNKNE